MKYKPSKVKTGITLAAFLVGSLFPTHPGDSHNVFKDNLNPPYLTQSTIPLSVYGPNPIYGPEPSYGSIQPHTTKEILNDNFVKKVIKKESNHRRYAISEKGAMGSMQVMPETWAEITGDSTHAGAFDPKENVRVGSKYLRIICNYYAKAHPNWEGLSIGEKRKLIAAAYNGGLNRLERKKWKVEDMPKETRLYVSKLESMGAF